LKSLLVIGIHEKPQRSQDNESPFVSINALQLVQTNALVSRFNPQVSFEQMYLCTRVIVTHEATQ